MQDTMPFTRTWEVVGATAEAVELRVRDTRDDGRSREFSQAITLGALRALRDDADPETRRVAGDLLAGAALLEARTPRLRTEPTAFPVVPEPTGPSAYHRLWSDGDHLLVTDPHGTVDVYVGTPAEVRRRVDRLNAAIGGFEPGGPDDSSTDLDALSENP